MVNKELGECLPEKGGSSGPWWASGTTGFANPLPCAPLQASLGRQQAPLCTVGIRAQPHCTVTLWPPPGAAGGWRQSPVSWWDAPSTWHGVDAPSMFAELNWIESLSMSVMVSSSGSRHSLHRLCFHCSASLLSSGQPRGCPSGYQALPLAKPLLPILPLDHLTSLSWSLVVCADSARTFLDSGSAFVWPGF